MGCNLLDCWQLLVFRYQVARMPSRSHGRWRLEKLPMEPPKKRRGIMVEMQPRFQRKLGWLQIPIGKMMAPLLKLVAGTRCGFGNLPSVVLFCLRVAYRSGDWLMEAEMTKYYEPEATPENPEIPPEATTAAAKTARKPLPSPKKAKHAPRQIGKKEDPEEYPTALDTERLKSWWSKYKVPRGSGANATGLLFWDGGRHAGLTQQAVGLAFAACQGRARA